MNTLNVLSKCVGLGDEPPVAGLIHSGMRLLFCSCSPCIYVFFSLGPSVHHKEELSLPLAAFASSFVMISEPTLLALYVL
jgi:hypothetical protein